MMSRKIRRDPETWIDGKMYLIPLSKDRELGVPYITDDLSKPAVSSAWELIREGFQFWEYEDFDMSLAVEQLTTSHSYAEMKKWITESGCDNFVDFWSHCQDEKKEWLTFIDDSKGPKSAYLFGVAGCLNKIQWLDFITKKHPSAEEIADFNRMMRSYSASAGFNVENLYQYSLALERQTDVKHG